MSYYIKEHQIPTQNTDVSYSSENLDEENKHLRKAAAYFGQRSFVKNV
ncbi:hypothetical protein MNB_SM-4-272 [hydrothermal vent metagenome]|uniref:Uncharacterized protein n=1 Tax=hydrothermal vent metagenome TaxID=652676 RepID=A0A1W1BQY5_9ZZZZ